MSEMNLALQDGGEMSLAVGEERDKSRSTGWRRNLAVVAAIVLVAALAVAAWWWFRPQPLHGTELVVGEPLPDFTMQASSGGTASLSDFRGKWVMLYFGYTFCPDVCPTTLGDMALAHGLLGRQAERVQGILVSLDPARDTPEKLAAYLSYFEPTFIGLSGEQAEVDEAAMRYGIFFERRAGAGPNDYFIDHTSSLLLIDPQGRLRVIYPYGVAPEEIAADVKYLMRRG
jgi:protein SCO1/2